MQIAVLYLSTAAIFLILDAIMLTLVMKPLFSRHIGPLMLTDIRVVPAAAFYAAYVAGLIWLVSLPALKTGSVAPMTTALVPGSCSASDSSSQRRNRIAVVSAFFASGRLMVMVRMPWPSSTSRWVSLTRGPPSSGCGGCPTR